jgi:hypothetical protein
MQTINDTQLPPVAKWRINAMRFPVPSDGLRLWAAMFVWSAIAVRKSPDWDVMRGLAKSMLAALALMSLLGVRYPLQMLPLMLYEIAWKTIWLVLIAGRAWMADKWTPDIEGLFYRLHRHHHRLFHRAVALCLGALFRPADGAFAAVGLAISPAVPGCGARGANSGRCCR